MFSVYLQPLLLLKKITVIHHELRNFHQQAGIVLQFFEARGCAHLLEVLDQIANAELFELSCLVLIGVDQELNNIVVVYVLHQSVLAEVL